MATTPSNSPYSQPDEITSTGIPLCTIAPFDNGLFGVSVPQYSAIPFPTFDMHEEFSCNGFYPISSYFPGNPPPPISESEISLAESLGSVPIELTSPTLPRSRSSPTSTLLYPSTPELPVRRRPSASTEGLGIDAIHRTPVSSPQPHSTFLPSTESIAPPPRRYYTPIAPNPAGLRQLQATKRSLSSEDDADSPSKKRKLSESPSPAITIEISDDDNFLLRLKDDEGLSWKEIAARFESELGRTIQIPALQMRLKRLREKMKVWTDVDVSALRMAHDYWLNSKFEIIASKMADFGSVTSWNPKQVNRKWHEIGFTHDTSFAQFARTPTFSTSYTSSPIEPPPHGFSFISSAP